MIFTMDNYIVGMIYKEISLFEWKYKVARREKDKEVGSIWFLKIRVILSCI